MDNQINLVDTSDSGITNKHRLKNFMERFMQVVFFVCALMSIVAVIIICLFMFYNGIPAMKEIGFFKFLFGGTWLPTATKPSFGIAPMILGSIYVTAGALIIGVPIGLFTAIFMAKFCPKKLYKFLMPPINLLAGIPSIIYGFFGVIVLVPFVSNTFGGNGNSILTASILLGMMILPTVVGMSESALRAVPESYYEGAVALGATHERAVAKVIFPAAKSGIAAAVVLAIGRAIGETMAVILVAGNQPRFAGGILDGVRTLTSNIVMEMGYATGLHYDALIATGVVLFVFILIINILLNVITNNKKS